MLNELHCMVKIADPNWIPKQWNSHVKINVVNNHLKFYICTPNPEPSLDGND